MAHRRFLDEDMNRVFPGDREDDARERRLAARLVTETEGMPALSIHTTHATPEPVAFVTDGHPRALALADALPVPHVVNERPVVEGAFSSRPATVTVEVGKPERHDATRKAVSIVRSFLRLTDVIDEPAEDHVPTGFYTITDAERKPRDAESPDLLAENFERVDAGESYARAGGETLVADEPFVPVLMSEAGYPDIFGYRGHRVADSLDGARKAWLSPAESARARTGD
jgi:succinylglutamate desuccinylase